ncbi:MAG: SRPBCC family protein [Pseudomonadota bacterium]
MQNATWSFPVSIVLWTTSAFCQTAEPYQIQASSKPVAGSRVRLVTCEAHFPADVENTWRLINAISDYPKFVPRVLASESLGTSDQKERVYILLNIPWPLPNIWNILSLTRDVDAHRVSWEMLDGNIKKNVGTLEVVAEEEKSAIRMRVTVDIGMGLPRWLVAWGAKKFLPKIMTAVGDRLAAIQAATPTPSPTEAATGSPTPSPSGMKNPRL